MTSAVAKRYARAVFALAVEAGDFEATGKEIAALATVFSNAEMAAFAKNPAIDGNTRQAVTVEVAKRLGLSQLASNFLGVLAEHGRLGVLAAIHAEYEKLTDRALGRLRTRVRSAKPLSDAALKRVRKTLAERTGKTIVAEVDVEPELLGGVVVEAQGRVYDASLATRLERMRQSLAGD